MKRYILLGLAAAIVLACVPSEKQALSDKADSPAAVPVDFTTASDNDLQSLGFALPLRKMKAPDFMLKSLDNSPRALSSYKGKLIFLNFWGVWCINCREEMPAIQRLYNRFRSQGLEIVAVDSRDAEEDARAYIAKNKYTFPVLFDLDQSVTALYGISGFPTTFIVDDDGYLRAMIVGGLDWDKPEVAAVFQRILAGR